MLRIYRRIDTLTSEIKDRFAKEFTSGNISEEEWKKIKGNLEELTNLAYKCKGE